MQVPVPVGGDVSYAVVQVRVTGPAKAPSGVYVAISSVRHAARNLRNVMVFVTRRRGTPGGLARAVVSFSVANATPVLHSFWVHGVNRAGVATVYTARNAITTALGNWSRYLVVLELAHALRAAMHPVGVSHPLPSSTATTAARTTAVGRPAVQGASRHSLPRSGLAFAGQRMDARVRAVATLIFATLGDRLAFETTKESPLAPQFIATELANPALAKRWRQVMTQLPIVVPDTYAANAREESKFTTVRAPLITRATVAVSDNRNAASQAAIDSPALTLDLSRVGQRVSLHFLGSDTAAAAATAYFSPDGYSTDAYSKDGLTRAYVDCQSDCSFFVDGGDFVSIVSGAGDNAVASGFQGCTGGVVSTTDQLGLMVPTCQVAIRPSGPTVNVSLFFDVPATRETTNALSVSEPGSGSGTVTSSPAGIACPTLCSNEFAVGQKVTLTAAPDSVSVFVGATGCDSTTARTCTVTLGTDRTVSMEFDPAPPASGSLDATFGTSGSVLTAVTAATSSAQGAKGLAIQPDGRYVAAGTGTDANGNVVTTVTRYTVSGALDPSFGTGGVAIIPASTFPGKTFFTEGVGIQPGTGDIIVGGTVATSAQGPGDYGVAALTPDGTLDTNFGNGGVVDTQVAGGGVAEAVLVDPSSGHIYLGGGANPGITSAFALVAYNADGSSLSSFGVNGQVITTSTTTATAVRALAFDGSEIVAAGTSQSTQGGQPLDGAVMRYMADGTPDPSFSGGQPATLSLGGPYTDANAVLVQSDHSIVIGGYGTYVPAGSGSPSNCMILARLTPAGALDTTFGQTTGFAPECLGSSSAANALVQTTDGAHIYALGQAYNSGGTISSFALTRFTAAGGLDTSFATGGVALTSPAGASNSAQGNAIMLDGADPVVAGQALAPGPPVTLYFALQRFK